MTPDLATLVLQSIASHFGLLESTLTRETRLAEDLGADEFDLQTILLDFEEETGGTILGLDLEDVKTVADLIKAIDTAASN